MFKKRSTIIPVKLFGYFVKGETANKIVKRLGTSVAIVSNAGALYFIYSHDNTEWIKPALCVGIAGVCAAFLASVNRQREKMIETNMRNLIAATNATNVRPIEYGSQIHQEDLSIFIKYLANEYKCFWTKVYSSEVDGDENIILPNLKLEFIYVFSIGILHVLKQRKSSTPEELLEMNTSNVLTVPAIMHFTSTENELVHALKNVLKEFKLGFKRERVAGQDNSTRHLLYCKVLHVLENYLFHYRTKMFQLGKPESISDEIPSCFTYTLSNYDNPNTFTKNKPSEELPIDEYVLPENLNCPVCDQAVDIFKTFKQKFQSEVNDLTVEFTRTMIQLNDKYFKAEACIKELINTTMESDAIQLADDSTENRDPDHSNCRMKLFNHYTPLWNEISAVREDLQINLYSSMISCSNRMRYLQKLAGWTGMNIGTFPNEQEIEFEMVENEPKTDEEPNRRLTFDQTYIDQAREQMEPSSSQNQEINTEEEKELIDMRKRLDAFKDKLGDMKKEMHSGPSTCKENIKKEQDAMKINLGTFKDILNNMMEETLDSETIKQNQESNEMAQSDERTNMQGRLSDLNVMHDNIIREQLNYSPSTSQNQENYETELSEELTVEQRQLNALISMLDDRKTEFSEKVENDFSNIAGSSGKRMKTNTGSVIEKTVQKILTDEELVFAIKYASLHFETIWEDSSVATVVASNVANNVPYEFLYAYIFGLSKMLEYKLEARLVKVCNLDGSQHYSVLQSSKTDAELELIDRSLHNDLVLILNKRFVRQNDKNLDENDKRVTYENLVINRVLYLLKNYCQRYKQALQRLIRTGDLFVDDTSFSSPMDFSFPSKKETVGSESNLKSGSGLLDSLMSKRYGDSTTVVDNSFVESLVSDLLGDIDAKSEKILKQLNLF